MRAHIPVRDSVPQKKPRILSNQPVSAPAAGPVSPPASPRVSGAPAVPRRRIANDVAFELSNPVRKAGLNLALVFLFIRITDVHELISGKFGTNLAMLYWFAIPAGVCFFLSGGFIRSLRETPIRLWMGFTAWILLCIPTSDWPGGSLATVSSYIRTDLPVPLLIAGMVMSWEDCKKVLNVVALAALGCVLISFLFPSTDAGRYELGINTDMANANDFAALLIMLMPFLLWQLIVPNRPLIIRVLLYVAIGGGLFTSLRTGSRGGLIALVVSLLVLMSKLSTSQRLMVAVGAFVLGGVLVMIVPGAIRDRLGSTFGALHVFSGGSSASHVDSGLDDESAESRWYLLKKSLLFTVQHPVFGVGPDQFANHEGFAAKAEGQHGNWHETHNAYTQVSSEDGLPALLFMLTALVMTLRLLSRTYRKALRMPATAENREIAAACLCTLTAMIGFCCAIFFLSLAYEFYLPMLIAIAVVLSKAAYQQWDLAGSAEPVGQIRPPWAPVPVKTY